MQLNIVEKMVSASGNPGPTNECTGHEGGFGIVEKIKDAVLDLV